MNEWPGDERPQAELDAVQEALARSADQMRAEAAAQWDAAAGERGSPDYEMVLEDLMYSRNLNNGLPLYKTGAEARRVLASEIVRLKARLDRAGL